MAGKPDLVLIPAEVPETRYRLSLYITSLDYTASSWSEAAQLMFEQSLFLSGKKEHWITHSYIHATLVYKSLLENIIWIGRSCILSSIVLYPSDAGPSF